MLRFFDAAFVPFLESIARCLTYGSNILNFSVMKELMAQHEVNDEDSNEHNTCTIEYGHGSQDIQPRCRRFAVHVEVPIVNTRVFRQVNDDDASRTNEQHEQQQE